MAEIITTYEPDNSLKKAYLSVFSDIFNEFKKNRWLTYQLFKRDFFALYKQSFMGIFWAFIIPLFSVRAFIILNHSGVFTIGDIKVPYPIYAILGVAFWQLFATGLIMSSNSLVKAGSMIIKINFSKKSLVVASAAQSGKKVLVVDADLRKPRQHKIFNIQNLNGLTNFLTDNVEIKDLLKRTQIPNLFLINSGPLPPNAAELLGSEKMASLTAGLKQQFDYVLFDTPPVLAVSDAMVLDSNIDGMILIVWGEKTSRDALKQAKEKLDLLNIKTLGVVINNIDIKKHGYYYKHYYYQYGGQEERL